MGGLGVGLEGGGGMILFLFFDGMFDFIVNFLEVFILSFIFIIVILFVFVLDLLIS